ncbi:META domain-containing protein [Flavobacterium sp. Fl-77]|uniref:META domain-containing protein n=1 Tax=Flavobacterium flavipigmentatum TaxID=2893884 RepID=A0AAJ2S8T2_9FLAO|nr:MULTISPECIES: META domain-containing protein [unclassified Flavobacterium]MDX6183424.1 META domain-containing protein [Flavobacterium sp. Fl-33]MDX6186708.1 META domain-containing protein [Flavobacterium sp. Fl-77]UFH38524.1 META domain-containing protein [Flavobacterium sp. F-70]
MKKIFILFIASILLISCKSVVPVKLEETKTEYDDYNYLFIARGNEPFWEVKIGTEQTVFKSLLPGAEKIVFSSVETITTANANVKIYKLSNSNYNFQITILKKECTTTMSGIMSPYSVQILIKKTATNQVENIEGCGHYVTDYRLHDIWVLEELNGKKVAISDVSKELPRIEINAAKNEFMGFGGCNSINGRLFYEKDSLRFTNVTSTMMACVPSNYEEEFLKTLQTTTQYFIGNNQLSLSDASGLRLIFRKVD